MLKYKTKSYRFFLVEIFFVHLFTELFGGYLEQIWEIVRDKGGAFKEIQKVMQLNGHKVS